MIVFVLVLILLTATNSNSKDDDNNDEGKGYGNNSVLMPVVVAVLVVIQNERVLLPLFADIHNNLISPDVITNYTASAYGVSSSSSTSVISFSSSFCLLPLLICSLSYVCTFFSICFVKLTSKQLCCYCYHYCHCHRYSCRHQSSSSFFFFCFCLFVTSLCLQ